MLKKLIIAVAAAILASYGLAYLILPERNPTARYEGVILSESADKILKHACFDCHSNETQWPWYTQIPPVNILLAYNVSHGREELNFSNWDQMEQKKRARKMEEAIEEAEEAEMPPLPYTWMHEGVVLTHDQIEELEAAEKVLFGVREEHEGDEHDHADK
ncbi:MAG: heme-binding domain-containing protein [bacterium]|nr:heme-binding domain-containing protein [bacterium]